MLDKITSAFHFVYSIPALIAWGGYTALFAIVFIETGLMVGFFLPGDSLLVTAGLFAARGDLNILYLIPLVSIAAIIGDSTGFWIGSKAGPKIFKKEESKLFGKKHLFAAEKFYEKHGGKTIILARFVPIIRTFAPVVAGVGKMDYKNFLTYNIVGGILWVSSMILGGYFLGKVIPNIDKNIHLVIAVVIVVSFLPMVFEYYKEKRARYRLKNVNI